MPWNWAFPSSGSTIQVVQGYRKVLTPWRDMVKSSTGIHRPQEWFRKYPWSSGHVQEGLYIHRHSLISSLLLIISRKCSLPARRWSNPPSGRKYPWKILVVRASIQRLPEMPISLLKANSNVSTRSSSSLPSFPGIIRKKRTLFQRRPHAPGVTI